MFVSLCLRCFSHLSFPTLLCTQEDTVLFSASCVESSLQTEILSFIAAIVRSCIKEYTRSRHGVTPCQREKTTVTWWGKSVAFSRRCLCLAELVLRILNVCLRSRLSAVGTGRVLPVCQARGHRSLLENWS